MYKLTGMSLFLFWFFMLAAEKNWICSNEDFLFERARRDCGQTTTTTAENRTTTKMAAALHRTTSARALHVSAGYIFGGRSGHAQVFIVVLSVAHVYR